MKKHFNKTSNFPRYALIFLLGATAVYFASAYTDINTALINATQYIQKIVLTDDGNQSGITGIVLNGVNGRISATEYCDLSGTNCKTIDTFGATGAMGPAGATGAIGATGAMGPAGTGGGGSSQWQQSGNNISYTSGKVGIGTNNPTQSLQISGNIGLNGSIQSPGFYSKGAGVNAIGDYSTAMGYGTLARRNGSTAMGWYTEANGNQSTSMGYQTYANGDLSTTMGYQTYTAGKASLAIGGCNEVITGAVFEIGIGLFTDYYNCIHHTNALTVLQNGKVGIGTSAPGALLTVNGGIKPIGTGSNPCGNTTNYPEGTMFYNSTSHYYCFCDNTLTGKKIYNEATNCF